MTPGLRRILVALGVLFFALVSAFGELDRLVTQAGMGLRFSIADVTSPATFAHLDQWFRTATTDAQAWRAQPFIAIYIVLDVVFIAVYSALAWLMIDHTSRDDATRVPPRVALGALVLADVAEDALLYIAGGYIQTYDGLYNVDGVPRRWAEAQAVASLTKWIILILFMFLVLRKKGLLASMGRKLLRAMSALFVQRVSLCFVIVLAVLSILPLHPILEQVPDIQRSWLDDGKAREAALAAAVLAILSVVFWFIGQATSERSVGERTSMMGINLAIWSIFPIAVLTVGTIAQRFSTPDGPTLLDPGPFRVFLGFSFSAVILSGGVELFRLWRHRHSDAKTSPYAELISVRPWSTLPEARRAGAILSAMIVALPALGLVRSLSTQVILAIAAPRPPGGERYLDETIPTDKVVISGALILVMLLLAVFALCFATGGFARTSAMAVALTRSLTTAPPAIELATTATPVTEPSTSATPVTEPSTTATLLTESAGWRVGSPVVAAVSAGVLTAMVLCPAWVGETFGPIAVTTAAVGAELVLVGLLSLALSHRAPLHVFRWLRSDPVLTIFLLMPIVVGQFAEDPALHSISRLPAAVPSQRVPLQRAFTTWLERGAGCVANVRDAAGSTKPIRPLMLVAAEGGGIRAAAWTVAGMSELVSAGSCASNSVFLSSGVSGGSIGLAIAANPPWDPNSLPSADQEGADRMARELREVVHQLGASGALAAGVQGLVVSDSFASTTGIHLPSYDSSWKWRDRAALIEQSWRDAYPPLSSPFDASAAAPTGLVVFNSTDIRSGCRVVVSQVELGPGDSGLTAPPDAFSNGYPTATCSEGVEEPALTIDLLDRFESCSNRPVDWAVAGLLSARFPVVTPSGTIGTGSNDCGRPRLQMVDGGYAENSGLGLLADTAPMIGQIVRDYNTTGRAPGDPLIVPYIMFMQNSPKPITEPLGIRDTPEAFVPLVGMGSGATQVAPSSWIQRVMASIGPLCNPQSMATNPDLKLGETSESECDTSSKAISWNAAPTHRVVIMQPDTQPSISVPLGWGLSDASYCQLVLDADLQGNSLASWPNPFAFGNRLADYLALFGNADRPQDQKC